MPLAPQPALPPRFQGRTPVEVGIAFLCLLTLLLCAVSVKAHHRDPTIPFCGDGVYEPSEFPNAAYECHGDNPANLTCRGNIVTGSGSSITYTPHTSRTGEACYTPTGAPGICSWYGCNMHLAAHISELPGNITITPMQVNAGEPISVTIYNPGADDQYLSMSTTVQLKKLVPGTPGHYLLNFRGANAASNPIEWYPTKAIDSVWNGVAGNTVEPLTPVAAPTISHDIVTSRPGVTPQTTTYYETAQPRFAGTLTINEPGTYTIEFQDMVANRIESAPFVVGPPQFSTIRGNVFEDLNEDGIFQAGEPGLEGWQVFVDANTNQLFDAGEIVAQSSAVTGNYELRGVDVGQHKVCEVLQSNHVQTHPGYAVNQASVVCHDISITAPNTTINNQDFGNAFTLIVTSANDAVDASGCTAGHCSLREALLAASGRAGPDKITFDITGSLPHRILPQDTLPALDDPVELDGTSQAGFSGTPVIIIDGSGAGNSDGLVVTGGGSRIFGLSIVNFQRSGIVLLTQGGNTIEGNHLGADPTGTVSAGNTYGISIEDSPNNTVGSLVANQGNLISGNLSDGVLIKGSGSTGNKIQGNRIGTDLAGQRALLNNFNGVSVVDAPGNTIGGIVAGAQNTISGNGSNGVFIKGATASGNSVQGNYIGLSRNAAAAVPNQGSGIYIDNAPNNTIGGNSDAARNIISGNVEHGLEVSGAGSSGTTVLRNYLGTNLAGTAQIGNQGNGITLSGATLVTIGSAIAADRNLMSGNRTSGILIRGQATRNTIRNNHIGADATGTLAVANVAHGIHIDNSPANTIEKNLIGGNGGNGILIARQQAENNDIVGNLIGVKAGNTGALPNTVNGILISDAASNTIGKVTGTTQGNCTGDCNVISTNGQDGVQISGATAINNAVRYNSIYENTRLGINLGNDVTTPNDNRPLAHDSDADTGPNKLLNFPVAVTAHQRAADTIISGIVHTNTAVETPSVDIYLNDKPHRSGVGQGQYYWLTVPAAQIKSDGSFRTIIAGALPHPFLSATTVNSGGSTSEFGPICSDPDGDGNPDSDGDGLCDSWESTGIDFDGDGSVDLNLPALGAQPNCRDIFVEIDHMPSHAPHPAHLANVTRAFARAPVPCPARGTGIGINLHFDLDTMDLVPHQDEFNDWTDFDAVKARLFGTAAQRSDASGNAVNAKRLAYRYALFIHARTGTTSSGRGELPGNDFMIALGAPGWGTRMPSGHTSGSRMEIESTFMHEMGHTLNLRHGGSDDNNCKPNYLSIMSYTFQFSNRVPGRPLDYSRSALAGLNESAALNEPLGIAASNPPGLRSVYGPVPNTGTLTGVPVDWDRNGDTLNATASADINKLTNGTAGCTGSGTNHPGFQDWNALLYNFRAARTFATGDHSSGFGASAPSAVQDDEMTPAMRREMLRDSDDPTLVIDITPPAFVSFPTDINTKSADPAGTSVSYSLPTLQDDIDPAPTVECIPGPGQVFPIGQTEVNCLASDTDGNFNERSFTVTVDRDASSSGGSPWLLLLVALAFGFILFIVLRR